MKKALIKLYDWSNVHSCLFYCIVLVILVLCFIGGYLFASNYYEGKVLSEEEFEYCEQIARNATLYEIPEDITISKSGEQVSIGIEDRTGKVVLKWEVGSVVTERDYEPRRIIRDNIFMGLGFFVIAFMIFILFVLTVCHIAEKR